MKYGLTRSLSVYGYALEKGETVIATAGDYLKSQMWCKKNLKGMDGGVADLLESYAWAWFALERNGKLDGYGIADEITVDGLTDMASAVSIYLETVPDDSLPLAGSPTQPKR